MATSRNQTITTLERTARRLLTERTPGSAAVDELHRISPDPRMLGEAAGRALGRWEAIPMFNPLGRQVAALLVSAGGDTETMESTADVTARKLRTYLNRG